MQNGFDANEWVNLMQKHYDSVYQKSMKAIPICNSTILIEIPVLQQLADGRYLGVIVTPWFINAVFKLVDKEGNDAHKTQFTAKVSECVTLKFPSGQYEFIVNYQPEVGYFYTCSLMSDMHALESHKVAVDFALECFKLIFNEEAKEQTNQQQAIKKIRMGQAMIEESQDGQIQVVDKPKPKPTKTVQEKLDTPVSRRGMFGLKGQDNPEIENRE
ncbi:hypothetical protein JCM30760_02800 [Thiomicrorhabdus hydrogeniphila]